MKRDLVVTKGTPGEVLNICFEVSQSRHVLVAVGEERREEKSKIGSVAGQTDEEKE